MPKIQYLSKRFTAPSRRLITQAIEIVEEYEQQGFDLTLRQLYYQFVSRGYLENKVEEYARLGDIVSNARLAGLIDWYSIVDRTRGVKSVGHWENPGEIISDCVQAFHIDKWKEQPYTVEVWIEKEALAGVISGICHELDISFLSCKGYTSQSEMWRAGRRLRRQIRARKMPIILHFGDHDPSGIDMTRDIRDRLELFSEHSVEIRRIALNIDQIEEFNPPPNPAKITDSRAKSYIYEYGTDSWELDALEPSVLVDLVRTQVEGLRDESLWEEAVAKEEQYKEELQGFAEQY